MNLFDFSVQLESKEYKLINDTALTLVNGIIKREPDPLKRFVLTEEISRAMALSVGEKRIILGIEERKRRLKK